MRLVSPTLTRLWGRALVAMTGAIAAVAVTTVAPVTSDAASSTVTPRCPAAGLVIWLDTQGSGTLGHVDYDLQLTNLSGRACTIRGYPRVAAIDRRGRRIGAAAVRLTGTVVRTVRLNRGATARADLRITDVGVFSDSRCRHVAAAGLRVFAPTATASRVIPFPFAACSRTAVRYLAIGPVLSQ